MVVHHLILNPTLTVLYVPAHLLTTPYIYPQTPLFQPPYFHTIYCVTIVQLGGDLILPDDLSGRWLYIATSPTEEYPSLIPLVAVMALSKSLVSLLSHSINHYFFHGQTYWYLWRQQTHNSVNTVSQHSKESEMHVDVIKS